MWKVLATTLLLAGAALAQDDAEVSVQVYYESNCPDSIAWMTEQLPETYDLLGQYLRIDFNPFGHADWEETDEGGYSFECQHGPNECYGNLYQACLLDKLDDNEVEVEAVICIMSADEPHYATDDCMEEVGITDPSYTEVTECQTSVEGEIILQQFGVETKSLDPPENWVPWITINGVYIEEDFDAMQYDLLNHLCTNYLADKPGCQ